MPKGQAHAAKTHCPQGHEYTSGNTRMYRGSRYCKQCHRDRVIRRKRQIAAERRTAHEQEETRRQEQGLHLCRHCEIEKSVTAFHAHSRTGLQAWCKECRREHDLERQYGISSVEVDALRDKQDARCALCRKEKSLCVDHCHRTGRIRGLLCKQCNHALGLFYDDTTTLRRALDYLEKP